MGLLNEILVQTLNTKQNKKLLKKVIYVKTFSVQQQSHIHCQINKELVFIAAPLSVNSSLSISPLTSLLSVDVVWVGHRQQQVNRELTNIR